MHRGPPVARPDPGRPGPGNIFQLQCLLLITPINSSSNTTTNNKSSSSSSNIIIINACRLAAFVSVSGGQSL